MKQSRAFRRVLSVVLLVLVLFTSIQVSMVSVSAAKYDNTHKNTGVHRKDIVAVAKTQVGYREGANNDTKYGAYMGMNYQPWCAMFVVWCARQAGIPSDIIRTCAIACPEPGYFDIPFYTYSQYKPRPGDLFFSKTFGHVGIVAEVYDTYFISVEGNSNNTGGDIGVGVFSNKRSYSTYYFGVPDYNYLSKGHTCKAGTSYVIEPTHPHKKVYTCIYCDKQMKDVAKDTYSATCPVCNTLESPVLKLNTESALGANVVRFTWNEVDKATRYDFDMDYKDSEGNWQIYEQTDYEKSGLTRTLPDGEYRVTVTAFNTTVQSTEFPQGVTARTQTIYFDINKTAHTITYDANGGENAPAPDVKQTGIDTVLTAQTPEREGYNFLGWSDKPDATSAKFKPGAAYTKDVSMVLYAVWKDNSLNLIGDSNEDGVVNIKDATMIQKHLASIESLTEMGVILAEVNGDGSVNIKDATAIQKYVAGMENEYNIGKRFGVEETPETSADEVVPDASADEVTPAVKLQEEE